MFEIKENDVPRLIDLGKIGSSNLGYITVAERLPFEVKRTYWTFYAPHDVIRGHHAHHDLKQLIVAVSGVIDFSIETLTNEKLNFRLDQPNLGLFIPKLCWREMKFSHNAVLLCLASDEYSESDYIRNYDDFKKLQYGANI